MQSSHVEAQSAGLHTHTHTHTYTYTHSHTSHMLTQILYTFTHSTHVHSHIHHTYYVTSMGGTICTFINIHKMNICRSP